MKRLTFSLLLLILTSYCKAQSTSKKIELSSVEDKKELFEKNVDLTPRLNPKNKSPYMWFDLKPGIYKNENCNTNAVYEWNRNSPGRGMAQMSLVELLNNKVISEYSTEEYNYEIIDGGLLLGNSKKLIITSEKSFITSDGCIWKIK